MIYLTLLRVCKANSKLGKEQWGQKDWGWMFCRGKGWSIMKKLEKLGKNGRFLMQFAGKCWQQFQPLPILQVMSDKRCICISDRLKLDCAFKCSLHQPGTSRAEECLDTNLDPQSLEVVKEFCFWRHNRS